MDNKEFYVSEMKRMLGNLIDYNHDSLDIDTLIGLVNKLYNDFYKDWEIVKENSHDI